MRTTKSYKYLSKDDLLEFLNNHAQGEVDVFGQLPEDESISISVEMRDHYSDVEFTLSYDVGEEDE